VATNLDRIGRNLRECLNLVHELREQGVGIKTLRDPIPIDTSDDSPLAQIAVAMLALFAEMERTFARERAAHARAVALNKGKLPGRPRKLNDHKLQAARASLDAGMHLDDLAEMLNIHRATLYSTEHSNETSANNRPARLLTLRLRSPSGVPGRQGSAGGRPRRRHGLDSHHRTVEHNSPGEGRDLPGGAGREL
jgi:DNA invertase Pin-like site-specific DNA recombinase